VRWRSAMGPSYILVPAISIWQTTRRDGVIYRESSVPSRAFM